MAFVAGEMEREASRSRCSSAAPPRARVHTAVKIEPHYSGPVVHVLDASRAVGVASALLSDGQRDAFVTETRAEYARGARAARRAAARGEVADRSRRRARTRFAVDWSAVTPPVPSFTGAAPRRARLPAWRPRAAHRLDAVLPDVGAGRALSGDPRRRRGRRRAPAASSRCAGDAEADRGGAVARGHGRRRVLPREPERRTTSTSGRKPKPRSRTSPSPSSTRSASRWRRTTGRPNVALADFVAPGSTGRRDCDRGCSL